MQKCKHFWSPADSDAVANSCMARQLLRQLLPGAAKLLPPAVPRLQPSVGRLMLPAAYWGLLQAIAELMMLPPVSRMLLQAVLWTNDVAVGVQRYIIIAYTLWTNIIKVLRTPLNTNGKYMYSKRAYIWMMAVSVVVLRGVDVVNITRIIPGKQFKWF